MLEIIGTIISYIIIFRFFLVPQDLFISIYFRTMHIQKEDQIQEFVYKCSLNMHVLYSQFKANYLYKSIFKL